MANITPAGSLLASPPTLNEFVVWDVETTGTNHKTDRITELAAVRVANGKIVGQLSTLVYCPEVTYIPARVTELTGISLEMCREHGLPERDALRLLWFFSAGSLMVAHNAIFDFNFTASAYERLSEGKMQLNNPILCSLTAARARLPFCPNHKLGTLASTLGLEIREAHRALSDVLTTADLVLKLHNSEPLEPLINVIGYPRKYPVASPASRFTTVPQ